MAATPEQERAAKLVAERVRKLVLDMLIAQELGEVAVIVTYHDLEPLKRVITPAKKVRIARGQMTALVRG